MNSPCDLVEALVYDELSADEAARVIRHVATCDACAAERAVLQTERRAFASRARLQTPSRAALPSFEAIIARANGSTEGVRPAEAIAVESEERQPFWRALVARRATWTSVAIAASAIAAVGTLLLITTTESPLARERAQSFARAQVPAATALPPAGETASSSGCDEDALICVDDSVAFVSSSGCASASDPLDAEEAASPTSNVFASFGEESAMCVAGSM